MKTYISQEEISKVVEESSPSERADAIDLSIKYWELTNKDGENYQMPRRGTILSTADKFLYYISEGKKVD